jgi:hypothetical protein
VDLVIRPDAFHHQFAADVDEQTAALMAVTQRPVAQAALSEGLPTETPAWKHALSVSQPGPVAETILEALAAVG